MYALLPIMCLCLVVQTRHRLTQVSTLTPSPEKIECLVPLLIQHSQRSQHIPAKYDLGKVLLISTSWSKHINVVLCAIIAQWEQLKGRDEFLPCLFCVLWIFINHAWFPWLILQRDANRKWAYMSAERQSVIPDIMKWLCSQYDSSSPT